MSADARLNLTRQQIALVQALVRDAPAPSGFDDRHVRAATESLLRKRTRAVRRAWPRLVNALGDQFDPMFAAFARSTPVSCGGPLADGRTFAASLAGNAELSDEARLEILAFDLRYKVTRAGLAPRRGLGLIATSLDAPRRLVIGVRIPLLGERWFRCGYWR